MTGGDRITGFGTRGIDDPNQRRPDITKAGQLLGWTPQIDFPTGLAKTLDYFRRVI